MLPPTRNLEGEGLGECDLGDCDLVGDALRIALGDLALGDLALGDDLGDCGRVGVGASAVATLLVLLMW